MKEYCCQLYKLAVYLCLLALTGCGSENESQPEKNISTTDTPELITPITTNGNVSDFKRVTFAYQRQHNLALVGANQVVGAGYLNTSGTLTIPTPKQVVKGNLTLNVAGVTDAVGVKRILLGFANTRTAVELCNATCSVPYNHTITGINPASFGLLPGIITAQIWLEDSSGNFSIVDSIAISWQPHNVVIDSLERTAESLTFSWLPISGFHRYNAYIAREPIDDVLQALTLLEGQQILALAETSHQFSQLNSEEIYFVKVTGIDASGESAFSDNHMVSASVIFPPNLVNDTYTVTEGELITGNVLENDDALGFLPLTVDTTPVRDTNAGRLDLFSDGSFSYLPNQGFVGIDTFRYRAKNRQGAVSEAEVSVVVEESIYVVTGADSYDLKVNQTLFVTAPGLLVNDFESSGASLTLNTRVELAPSNGQLTLVNDGSFAYIPNKDYVGEDRFQYRAENSLGDFAVGEVSLRIIAEDPPKQPIAVNDQYATNEDVILNVPAPGVLANDIDESDGRLQVIAHSQSQNGVLTLSADGALQYIPNNDFSGQEIIDYTIQNENSLQARAQLIINIVAVNDPPVAVDDNFTVDSAQPSVLEPLANDFDIDGNISDLRLEIVRFPSNGSAEVSAENEIKYQSNLYFRATDTLTYRVIDLAGGESNTATVTINVNGINTVPKANDDSAVTSQPAAVAIPLLSNDEDLDGSLVPNTVKITQAASNGKVSLTSSGVATYTPNRQFYGKDSFYYQVQDNDGAFSNIAEVAITVTQTNSAPIAVNDVASTFVNSPIEIAVLDNDSDEDNNLNSNSLELVDAPKTGSVTITAANTFLFTPVPGFIGEEGFSYRVYDDFQLASNLATVTLTIVAPPVANNDLASTQVNNGVSINVLANDDAKNFVFDDSSLRIDSPPSNGLATVLAGTTTIRYEPNTDFAGSDSFSYSIATTSGYRTVPANVTITVQNVNQAPVAVADAVTVETGNSVTIDVLSNDSDADGSLDSSTIQLVTLPVHGSASIVAAGTVSYTANDGYTGSDSLSYQVSDNDGRVSNIAAINITVTEFNQIPEVDDVEETIFVDAGAGYRIAVIEVENEEGQSLTYTLTGENNQLFELTSEGELLIVDSMQIQTNGEQSYVLSVSVCDSGTPSKCGSAQLTIQVIERGPATVISRDMEFANNGELVIQSRSTLEYHAPGKAILDDEGLLIYASAVGSNDYFSEQPTHRLSVSRLTASGHLDNNFADQGVFISDLDSNDNVIAKALLQDDQKRIYVTGYQGGGEDKQLFILRLTKEGQLDTNYAEGKGYVIISEDNTGSSTPVDILYEDNGVVTLLVNTEQADNNNNGILPIHAVNEPEPEIASELIRINAAGDVVARLSLDFSAPLNFESEEIRANGMLVLPDNNYLVYGSVKTPLGNRDAFFAKVDRLLLTLDMSYQNNGMLIKNLSGAFYDESVLAASLTAEQDVIATGTAHSENSDSESLFVLKMDALGELDTGLNDQGYKIIALDNLPVLSAGLPDISDFKAQGKGITKVDDNFYVSLSRKNEHDEALVQQWIKVGLTGEIDSSWGTDLSHYNEQGISTTGLRSKGTQLFSYGVSQTLLCCDDYSQLWVTNINSIGTVNDSFGNQGKVVFDTAPSKVKLQTGLSLSDAETAPLLLAGKTFNYNNKEVPFVTQLSSNGAADFSFANYSKFFLGINEYGQTTSLLKGQENDIYVAGKQVDNKAFILKLSEQGVFDQQYGLNYLSDDIQEIEIQQLIEESLSRQWLLSKKEDYCAYNYSINIITDGELETTASYDYDLNHGGGCNLLDVTLSHIEKTPNWLLSFGVDSVNYPSPRLILIKTEYSDSDGISFQDTTINDIDIGILDGQYAVIQHVFTENTGNYLIIGTLNNDLGGHLKNFIVRVTAQGELLDNFANDGVLIIETLNDKQVAVNSAWLKGDTKLVLAAQEKQGSKSIYLAQINLQSQPGTFDNSFNSSGYQLFLAEPPGTLKFVIQREGGSKFIVVLENDDPEEYVLYSGQFE